MLLKKLPIALVVVILIILIYVAKPWSFLTTDSSFDPTTQFRIQIIDTDTDVGVSGVPITFFPDCPEIMQNDATCGGKYVLPESGTTDSYGYLVRSISTKTTPLNILNFKLGERSGYNTDIGTGTFIWETGLHKDVKYKIISQDTSTSKIDQEKLIVIVESTPEFISWESQMTNVTNPNIDTREGLWRIYYSGTKNNTGDWMIIFNVDTYGKVISVKEPMQKILR